MWIGLVMSIFPDSDLLYFYLVDHRRVAHHHYITHMPMVWLAFGLVGWALLVIMGKKQWRIFLFVAVANALLHMALDTTVGGIHWFYPFLDWNVKIIEVPSAHGWWVWNFVFHWTFLLEILAIAAAAMLWLRERKEARKI